MIKYNKKNKKKKIYKTTKHKKRLKFKNKFNN